MQPRSVSSRQLVHARLRDIAAPALAERTGDLARLEVKVGEPCLGGLLVPLPHVGCLLLHGLQRDLQLGRLLDLGVFLGLCSSQRPQATIYRDA